MKPEEIEIQLNRLTMYGNLEDNEFKEYTNTLSRFSYDDLKEAVDGLVETFQGHSFPKPPDIISAIRAVISKRDTVKWGKCGSPETNAAFMACFRLAGNLVNDRMKYYYTVRFQQQPMNSERDSLDFYREVRKEIEHELGINSRTVTVKTDEDMTPIDELGF